MSSSTGVHYKVVQIDMKTKTILLAIWSVLTIAVLVWSLCIFLYVDSRPNSDAETVLYGLTSLLTFPAGSLMVIPIGGIFWVIKAPAVSVTVARLVAIWLAMVFAGYFQWFRLVPMDLPHHQGEIPTAADQNASVGAGWLRSPGSQQRAGAALCLTVFETGFSEDPTGTYGFA